MWTHPHNSAHNEALSEPFNSTAMKSSERSRLVLGVLAVLLVIGILAVVFSKADEDDKSTGPVTAAKKRAAL